MNTIYKLLAITVLLLPLSSLAEIYQWTDEHGITHFGDKTHTSKKQQNKAKQVELKLKQQRNFDLKIIPVNYHLPYSVEQKVQLSIRKIHQIYTQRGLPIGLKPQARSFRSTGTIFHAKQRQAPGRPRLQQCAERLHLNMFMGPA